MSSLARELESKGYLVSNAEMAWSGRRLYNVDYPTALKEIEQEVQQLRAKGAKRVVVAGQSMGSNAAVAYASSGFDLDGLVVLSPGHFPEGGMGKRLRPSLERARSMVAANRGAESESLDDINQGKQRSIKIAASTYISYFDPDGLGAITKNIKKLSKVVPVLLVIGTADPFYPESKAMFDSAPPHALNRYVALGTDHFNIPKVAAAELLKWLDLFAQ
jgi:pimeloyl-ACP methyl ester carboxylesterase